MKFLATAVSLGLAIANTVQAAQISCSLNLKESQRLVSQKAAKDSETRHVVSDLKNFVLDLDQQGLRGGQIMAMNSMGAQEISFGADGSSVSAVNDNEMKISYDQHKSQVDLSVDGWDHFYYQVRMDAKTEKAFVSGDFNYDCGDQQKMHAVYDCKMVQ